MAERAEPIRMTVDEFLAWDEAHRSGLTADPAARYRSARALPPMVARNTSTLASALERTRCRHQLLDLLR
jgi:hypothetical protein